jgi:hypothetical protein
VYVVRLYNFHFGLPPLVVGPVADRQSRHLCVCVAPATGVKS